MGKDVVASKTGRIVVPNDGMLGSAVPVTELRVVFRAWSDDDLTESLGQVFQDDDLPQVFQDDDLPAEQVEHMGDQRFSQGDDNYFVSRWRFNVQNITPGEYGFNFSSGDDGWLYDVGVSNILTVEVVPTREGLRPDTHDQDPQLAEQPREQLEPGQRPR